MPVERRWSVEEDREKYFYYYSESCKELEGVERSHNEGNHWHWQVLWEINYKGERNSTKEMHGLGLGLTWSFKKLPEDLMMIDEGLPTLPCF